MIHFKIQVQPGWIAKLSYEVNTDPQDAVAEFCYYEGLPEDSIKKVYDVLVKGIEATKIYYPHVFIDNSREEHLREARERKTRSSKKDCIIQ
jgi:hypothetical protein